MIVTCEQCATQFQLEDSKVPARGVRVRCSRCKHAFFVKPQTEAGGGVERAVEQALERDASPDLGTTPDEGSEESDWEFNHEPGALDQAPDMAREAVDDLLQGSEPDVEMDPDIGSEAEGSIGSSVDDLLAGSDDEFGDDSSSGLEIDTEPLQDTSEDRTPFGDLSVPEEPPAPDPSALLAPEPARQPPAPEARLESPENWNFFDEQEAPASAPERSGGSRIALGRVGAARRRPPVEVDKETSTVVVWLERLVHGVGWTGVALLTAFGLHGGLGLGGAHSPPGAAPQVHAVGDSVELGDLAQSWVDNAASGTLYVVSGELRGRGSRQLPPGTRFEIRLLDAAGQPVAGATAALGAELEGTELRTQRASDLRARLAADADARAWSGDGSRRVQAVMQDVPARAERWDVVAVPVARPPPPPEPPAEEPT